MGRKNPSKSNKNKKQANGQAKSTAVVDPAFFKTTVEPIATSFEAEVEEVDYWNDASIFLGFYASLIVRNHFQSTVMYEIYTGKLLPGYFMQFFLVMRVATTRFMNGAEAKPFWRNLIFNMPRQFYPILWPYFVLGKPIPDLEGFINQAVQVTVLTIAFQYMPRWPYVRFRIIWLWLLSEFFMLFPFALVSQMNEIHQEVAEGSFGLGGDFIYGAFAIWCAIHNRLGPMMVEDLYYGDMNLFNFGIVPSNYFTYLFTVPALYAAQVYVRGASLSYSLIDTATGDKCANPVDLLSRKCKLIVNDYQADVSFYNSADIIIYDIANVVMSVWIVYGLLGSLRKLNAEHNMSATKKKMD